MTAAQSNLICGLMVASVLFLSAPLIWGLVKKILPFFSKKVSRKADFSRKLVIFSVFLIVSIWCIRYAVGYYKIISDESGATLTWWEEIFNSIAHALQTFSMDEEYTEYILAGKEMLRAIGPSGAKWATAYGLYACVLNFAAPIAGGAIIFEIIANIFPRVKLHLSFWAFWKEKYYFSELSERSLALVKSICNANRSRFFRPTVIFTDTYVSEDNEKGSEIALEAKQLGAVCIRDDLSLIAKNKLGNRKFFLIAEDEMENLQMLTNLSNEDNYRYLKKAEIYLFSQSDMYTGIERSVQDKLKNDYRLSEEELPTIIPIQSYRNLITNLLVELPLYEPLVHKKRKEDGTVDLNVTLLGTGAIGTEMFLSTYWFGQMLDCHLNINIVSKEKEEAFWGRIDFVNPEIRRTTLPGDPILRYNRKGDCSEPYCNVRYFESDVMTDVFSEPTDPRGEREGEREGKGNEWLDSDYVLVALGSDEDNLLIANQVSKQIGRYHLSAEDDGKTVIVYVVYDSDLCENLNRAKYYCSGGPAPDIYMQAIGSLDDVYSVKNIFMSNHESTADKYDEAYHSAQNRQKRADLHRMRMADDYKHWANLARGMHDRYRVFSLGFVNTSLFDVKGLDDPAYTDALRASNERYNRFITGGQESSDESEKASHIEKLHRMSWLEHRRWNAFTRVKGFRYTADYEKYHAVTGSYKHMALKLHPCLVECDQKGIRAVIDEKGVLDESTVFGCNDRSELDLLDELSYKLHDLGYNDYDFKQYDYPTIIRSPIDRYETR